MQTDALAAMAGLRAAFDAFAACDVESLSRAEVVALLDEYEELMCQLPAPLHRLLAQLQAGTTPKEMGAKSWKAVLRIRWRLSTAEAGRRLREAAELGPRRALTGEPLAPVLGVVAAAQAAGLINADHVKVLRDAVDALPGWVDPTTRDQFEADLVGVAVKVAQGAQGHRRAAVVSARSGRPRARRHRTRPYPRGVDGQAGSGWDDGVDGEPEPGGCCGVGGVVRQVRRAGHVQPGR